MVRGGSRCAATVFGRMGKASSTKKIQRVQRAGTTKVAGQRRPLGFPLAVLAVVVVGSVLVWLARDSRVGQSSEAPIVGDHWHYGYGSYHCDSYPDALQKLPDGPGDPFGIHTHADGLIHIHPFSTTVTGKNATFQKFADQIGMEISDDEVTFPAGAGGDTWKSPSTCTIDGKKKKAVLKVFVWPPQASEKVKPEVFTEGFGKIRFTDDGGMVVVALVPEDTKTIPLPPSVEQLKNPLEAEGGGTQEPTDGAATTLPAVETPTTTAAAGSPTTTAAPAAEQTTTTAG